MYIFSKKIQEAQKREKDAAKKAIKKERKQLRGICKDAEFFADDEVRKPERFIHRWHMLKAR